jgi:hypothetical protein
LTKTHGQLGTIERHGVSCPACPIRRRQTRNTSSTEFAVASGLSDLSGRRTGGTAAITATTVQAWRKTELVNTNGGEQIGRKFPENERFERH